MERIYGSRRIYSGIVLLLLLLLVLFNGDTVLASGVYNWSGQKDVGNWNGKTVYEDGWSEWSTTKPTDTNIDAAMFVRATIYLPVTSWSKESCSTSTKDIITVTENSFVRKEQDSYKEYQNKWATYESACDGNYSGRYKNYDSGCGCDVNTNDPTEYCSSTGGYGNLCSSSVPCGSKPGYTHQCYWIHCQGWTSKLVASGCHDYSTSKGSEVCSTREVHCYYTSSLFLDKTNTSNWKKSLSEAGGYAKKVYVYSYPERVYVEYNGNNATSICGNGDTASWNTSETTANDVNSNTNIIYEFGNPTCSTEFTNKSMSSASNSNSSTYLEYSSGGTLKENEYYKIGYDFVGWNTKADGSGVSFSDKEQITKAYFQSGGKLSAYKPGETFTLYAQWNIHTYNVTFSYKCGDVQNITYQYGTGSDDLEDLDVSACNSSTDNEGSKFLGWFEDTSYTSKIEKIPSTYYRDLTLYAKERQVRYFNYEQGKWIYTSDEEILGS